EIVAQGRGSSSVQQFYKKNNRWTEGLISAAKAVAYATTLLIESADGVLSGTHSLEQLIVASNEVSSATAQLVAASRVKASLMSKTQDRLEMAARAVTEACKALVRQVKAITAKQLSEEQLPDFSQMAIHEFKVREMEQQVEILKLEKELGAARHRLGAMRRAGYHATEEDGVDVYVIDTGIRTTHEQYEGRAEMIFSLPGLADTDDNGHGSHVSGTIAGATFGVAKKASLFGIKVMDSDGSGSTSGIIQGIQVAMQAAAKTNRPSVINMSIGGAGSRALDSAATAAFNSGMFVVVAAGNDAVDAGTESPARAPAAITVGAMNIRDRVSTFSNFGASVDIFAPGEDIISCGIEDDSDVASLSGTSMATPHIAGLVALLASQQPDITPTGMTTLIKSLGTQNLLRGVPTKDTINLIAQNSLPDSGIATTSQSLISTTAAAKTTKTNDVAGATTTFN
ncbi:sla2 Src-like adaptor 2, partial [Tulasnella sp. 427]